MKLLDILKTEFDDKNVISKADLNKTDSLKILVVGESGTGKTYSFLSLPDMDSSVFVDCERGYRTLSQSKRDALNIVSVDDWTTLRDTLIKLEQMKDVSTIFIDCLSEIDAWCKDEVLKISGKTMDEMSQYEWTMVLNRLKRLLRFIKNMKKNVILTAHVKNEQDTDLGIIVKKPMITGQLRDQIERDFDVVLCAVTGQEESETTYNWITAKDKRTPAKDRFGLLPTPSMKQDFTDLFNRIEKGGEKKPAKK